MVKLINPTISVIVPAYNEEANIEKCIHSLISQNFRYPFEIIVVNGPSKDNTSQILKVLEIKVIDLTERGINIAWQKGSESANAEILAFTEADCVVPNNWLSTIYKEFELDSKLVGLTGEYRVTDRNLINKIIAYFMPRLDRIYKSWTGYYPFRGTNFAIRKKYLIKIGGFNTKMLMYGDLELSTRIGKYGTIKHLSNLLVQTSNRNYASLITQIKFITRALKAVYLIAILKKPHKMNYIHS